MPNVCAVPNEACEARCVEGDGGACLARAYAVERGATSKKSAEPWFERACQLGIAVGCTNYAATIWGTGGTAQELRCSRRMFDKACAASEPFACGMVGRMLYEAARTPEGFAGVRSSLEHSCEAVKGFPCRVLAKYLEDGKLGTFAPSQIGELLSRACDGGDKNACGAPATANETFH